MTKMRKWSVLTVIAVIVVFAAGWFMLVKPEKSKVADLKSQATTQNEANQRILTQIAALQAEQKQLPAQQLALQKFSTEVPNSAAEPTLIRQLSTAANGAGVDLISMTPGTATALTATAAATGSTSLAAPAAGGSLSVLPIAVGVTGSYANVESFFQSLESLPRALLVSGWSLCPLPTAASSGTSASGAAGCTVPTVPTSKTPPAGSLGATLSADVFYAAPPVLTPTTTTGTTGTTTPTTTTPSTAATPSATTTPAATTTAATTAAGQAASSTSSS